MEYFDGEQIKRGRNLVRSIIFIVLIVEILNIVYFTLTNTLENVLKQLLYLAIVVIAAYLFYKGNKWTGYVILLMLGQNILAGLFYLLHQAGILLAFNGWLMLILTIIVASVIGIFLGGSDSITAFMKYQKSTKPR
ncbi:hypothetical protein [Brevibacillus fluminis]|nr:hypothetical protein [Brevibacillus fluminis]